MNIIERAITPFNPASNRVQNKDRYNLFAPVAGTNKVGMAGFNPGDFAVEEQIVSLSERAKDQFLHKVDVNNIPEHIRYDGPDGIKTPEIWYYNYEGGSLLVSREGDRQLEMLFIDGEIKTRVLTIVGDTITEVTTFSPYATEKYAYDLFAAWRDGILDQNKRQMVRIYLGTKAEIDAVEDKVSNTIYIPTDGMPDIEELMARIEVLEHGMVR